MKIFLQAVLIIALIPVMQAQPTITRSSLMSPGDELFVADAETTPSSPGASGAGALWDFSNVSPDGDTFRQIVGRADTTPYAQAYPGANLALIVSDQGIEVYEYDNLTDDFFEGHGSVIGGFATVTFSDPRRFLDLPVSFGDSWSDEYAYTNDFIISPVSYVGEGTITGNADAYGTLLLPQGAFNDAIRIRMTEESTDTAYLGFDTSERNYYYDTTYVWLSPSYHGPLCSYSKSRQVTFGYLVTPDTVIIDSETLSSVSFTYDPEAEAISGTKDVVAPGEFGMKLSPNPFFNTLELTFTSERPEHMHFQVQDITGRVVYQQPVFAHEGENVVPVSVPDIAQGTYIVILKSSQKGDVQKLIRLAE